MAHILIVDDEAMLRRTLRAILEKGGHKVSEAGDGKRAIEMFTADKPDLVLTDIIMPNREGIETIGELRRQDPHLPIIAMSGGGRTSAELFLTLASNLGATTTLAKPIRQAELIAAIDASLSGAAPP